MKINRTGGLAAAAVAVALLGAASLLGCTEDDIGESTFQLASCSVPRGPGQLLHVASLYIGGARSYRLRLISGNGDVDARCDSVDTSDDGGAAHRDVALFQDGTGDFVVEIRLYAEPDCKEEDKTLQAIRVLKDDEARCEMVPNGSPDASDASADDVDGTTVAADSPGDDGLDVTDAGDGSASETLDAGELDPPDASDSDGDAGVEE